MSQEDAPAGGTFSYDLDENWRCEYRVAQGATEGGQPVIAEMTIRPREKMPRGGLTSRFLRRIKLGEHLADITRQLQQRRSPDVRPLEERTTYTERGLRVDMNPAELALYAQGVVQDDGQPRAGRRGRTDLWYAQLASEYVNALGHGSRKPTAEIAHHRFHDVSHIRDALHEARERGLLTRPGTKGRPGGRLTAKAQLLLFRAEQETAKPPPRWDDDLWWQRRPPQE